MKLWCACQQKRDPNYVPPAFWERHNPTPAQMIWDDPLPGHPAAVNRDDLVVYLICAGEGIPIPEVITPQFLFICRTNAKKLTQHKHFRLKQYDTADLDVELKIVSPLTYG